MPEEQKPLGERLMTDIQGAVPLSTETQAALDKLGDKGAAIKDDFYRTLALQLGTGLTSKISRDSNKKLVQETGPELGNLLTKDIKAAWDNYGGRVEFNKEVGALLQSEPSHEDAKNAGGLEKGIGIENAITNALLPDKHSELEIGHGLTNLALATAKGKTIG